MPDMHLGWATALQALILAACTWYVRHGSKVDSLSVSAASKDVVQQIFDRLKALELDIALVKRATLKDDNDCYTCGFTPQNTQKGTDNGKSL